MKDEGNCGGPIMEMDTQIKSKGGTSRWNVTSKREQRTSLSESLSCIQRFQGVVTRRSWARRYSKPGLQLGHIIVKLAERNLMLTSSARWKEPCRSLMRQPTGSN